MTHERPGRSAELEARVLERVYICTKNDILRQYLLFYFSFLDKLTRKKAAIPIARLRFPSLRAVGGLFRHPRLADVCVWGGGGR